MGSWNIGQKCDRIEMSVHKNKDKTKMAPFPKVRDLSRKTSLFSLSLSVVDNVSCECRVRSSNGTGHWMREAETRPRAVYAGG